MENRFGIKDVFLFALLIGLGGLVALAMVQYDRQWSTLQDLSHKLDEQSGDLAALRRTLDHGVAMVPTTPAAGIAAGDPSARVRAATTMPGYAAHDWYVASGPNSDKLTPLVSGDAFANTIQNRVLETLVTRDPVSLQWVPLLALPGWTVEDHIADWHRFVDPKVAAGAKVDHVSRDPACPSPIRVTYHIRPGVTFSDGVPLTADDVKWTFDWTLNPAVEAPRQRSSLDKVKRVVRTGTDGVTFELSEPYFDPGRVDRHQLRPAPARVRAGRAGRVQQEHRAAGRQRPVSIRRRPAAAAVDAGVDRRAGPQRAVLGRAGVAVEAGLQDHRVRPVPLDGVHQRRAGHVRRQPGPVPQPAGPTPT